MPTTRYSNLQVLDAASPWRGQLVDVRVDGTTVLATGPIGSLDAAADETVVDCTGQGVTTGFFDLAAESPFPGFPQRGSLDRFAKEAYLGGFAAVGLQPQTDPPLATPEALQSVQAAASRLPVALHPWGGISASLTGEKLSELGRLQTAGAIGFTEGASGTPTEALLRLALGYNTAVGLPLWVDPFTLAPTSVRTGAVGNESAATVGLGLTTAPAEWEAEAIRQLSEWATYEAGSLQNLVLGPITTAAGVAALPAGVKAFTAPHYLLLSDALLASFDPRYKVFPPLRTPSDAQALIAALKDGRLSAIASYHTPLTLEEKHHDFASARAGMPALHSAFAVLHTALVAPGHLAPPEIVALLQGGYKLLGLPTPVLDATYRRPLFRVDVHAAYVPYNPTPVYDLAYPYAEVALTGRVEPLVPFPAHAQ